MALRNRFGDRFIHSVVPMLARGLLTRVKGTEEAGGELTRPSEVYQGALVLLFRLLFLLYAESRGLVTVRTGPGDREESLTRLVAEIAEVAGVVEDDIPRRLASRYSADPTATALHDRLLALPSGAGIPPDDERIGLHTADLLLRHKVPDRCLALALDGLARGVDDESGRLAPIDYRSLDVRLIGGIYERLLSLRLRIASEPMARAEGESDDHPEPANIALETDRRSRRSTGSFYTPEHVVSYVVERAVRPVLQEHLERLRPRFAGALEECRTVGDQRMARDRRSAGLNPGGFANDARGRRLADDLFAFHILDPAMGSGNFLIAAADFIAGQILDFLNGFPWNPIQAVLCRTRDEIVAELEHRGIPVDPTWLTDFHLLRRHVLTRCIHGVDLDPLAVELAKRSLWLHCEVAGVPLSCLDHHLKCGNALIGEAADGVQAERPAAPPERSVVRPRRRLMVRRSARARPPLKHRATRHQEQGTSPCTTDYSPPSQAAPNGSAGVLRSFHWHLEFPEVFVDPAEQQWKPPDRRGFDAVVGNPPYDVVAPQELGHDMLTELAYYRTAPLYEPARRGKLNVYKLFLCRGISLLNATGALSYVVPMALLGDDQAAGVRRLLLERTGVVAVEAFPQKDVRADRLFPEAKLATAIITARAGRRTGEFVVRTHSGRRIDPASSALRVRVDEIARFDPDRLPIPSCTRRDWDLALRILAANPARFGTLTKLYQGEVNETVERRRGTLADPAAGPLVVRGAALTRYAVREASQGEPRYLAVERFLQGKGATSRAYDHRRRRIGLQRKAPQNNFRRLIAAPIPAGTFCFESVSYCVERDTRIDLDLLLALLNSKLLEWYFRLGSSNAQVNEYQFDTLPVPRIVPADAVVDWSTLIQTENWPGVTVALRDACAEPGVMPAPVAAAIAELSRRLQAIESGRVLNNRSDRARLAPESQPIQDAIDAILFRRYGLDEDDARYVEQRLQEML